MIIFRPTFEIETVGTNREVVIGFFDGKDYIDFVRETEEDDPLLRFLMYLKDNIDKYKNLIIYSEKAASYGNSLVLNKLSGLGEVLDIKYGKRRIIWTVKKEGKKQLTITFEDMGNLVIWNPNKILKSLTDNYLEKLLGKSIDKFKSPLKARGYKDIKLGDVLSITRATLRDRTLKLSECCSKFTLFFMGNLFVEPAVTLSSSTQKVFRKKFLSPDIEMDPNKDHEEFIRYAIYGGRNEVYKRYGEDINQYDFHSMYPSCYDTPVPIGRMEWVSNDKISLDRGTLCEATVYVPETEYIGPLPHKDEYNKLVFPVGRFRDWWDMLELRNAVKNGTKVLEIHKQLECYEYPVLESFKLFIEKKRQDNPKQDFIWKEIGIQPSGKYGQRRESSGYAHFSKIKDFNNCSPVDYNEEYFEYPTLNSDPNIIPAISMRIRAAARIKHYNMLKETLKLRGELYYCDTDSIFTNITLPIGKGFGELGKVGTTSKRGYFIRQKLYGLVSFKDSIIQKSAGYSDIALTELDFKKLLNGEILDTTITKRSPSIRELLSKEELKIFIKHQTPAGKESQTRIVVGSDTKPICIV